MVEARFDEFNLDVKISYRGAPLELPDERPSDRDIMETEEGYRRLAGFPAPAQRRSRPHLGPKTAPASSSSISSIE